MDNVCIVKQLKRFFSARGHNQRYATKKKKQKQKIVEIKKKNVCSPKGEIIHTVSIRWLKIKS